MIRLPRQSKDILLKHLAGAFPDDALAVLGLDGIHVERVLPTELPIIEVRQGFTDVVLELHDHHILHLEFQSKSEATLDRFLVYDAYLYVKWHRPIRTIVLYTGRYQPRSTTIDAGTLSYQVERIYLRKMDDDAILETVEQHLETGQWDGHDRIRLAFALHMHCCQINRNQTFTKVLTLTQRIPNDQEKNYVTALILGLSGSPLTPKQSEQLKEVLRMTEVLREIEREAEQRGEQRGREEGRAEGLQEGLRMKALAVAQELLALGLSVDMVVQATKLSREEVEALAR